MPLAANILTGTPRWHAITRIYNNIRHSTAVNINFDGQPADILNDGESLDNGNCYNDHGSNHSNSSGAVSRHHALMRYVVNKNIINYIQYGNNI